MTGGRPLIRSVRASVHGAIDPSALRAEGVDPAAVVDFSSNQSPLGAAPGVAHAVAGAVVDAYPDPHAPHQWAAAGHPCTSPARTAARTAASATVAPPAAHTRHTASSITSVVSGLVASPRT